MLMLTLLTYQPVDHLYLNYYTTIMLVRQERIALLLLIVVTITVVAAHAILTMAGKQPFARPFSDHAADGELVMIDGIVEKVTRIENGGHLSLLIENTTVFIPASAAQGLIVHKNDSIIVYGIVQTHRGKKEIVVSTPEDIRITTVP